jgi:hypothetical protein
MWEPQPLTTLRASKACRGEKFTFTFTFSSILHILGERPKRYINSVEQLLHANRPGSNLLGGLGIPLCCNVSVEGKVVPVLN